MNVLYIFCADHVITGGASEMRLSVIIGSVLGVESSMTKVQILEIQHQSKLVHTILPLRHQKELDQAWQRLHELESICDHKNPDGSSAIEDGFILRSCSICHENDLRSF